jgi:hypothetical protein
MERFGPHGVDAVKAKSQIIAALRPQLTAAMGWVDAEGTLLRGFDPETGE